MIKKNTEGKAWLKQENKNKKGHKWLYFITKEDIMKLNLK